MNSAKHLDHPKTRKSLETNIIDIAGDWSPANFIHMFWTRSYLEDHPDHFTEQQSYMY